MPYRCSRFSHFQLKSPAADWHTKKLQPSALCWEHDRWRWMRNGSRSSCSQGQSFSRKSQRACCFGSSHRARFRYDERLCRGQRGNGLGQIYVACVQLEPIQEGPPTKNRDRSWGKVDHPRALKRCGISRRLRLRYT